MNKTSIVNEVIEDLEYWRRHFVNPEQFLKKKFQVRMGYPLNLEDPKTFNEKLQWLKLHDHNPNYITMVDKFAVKKYVASRIGEQYIIPTLGVWDRFEDIDFDKLPNQFVLKCTHDSGGLAICKDKSKFDFQVAKRKIKKSLRTNYFYGGFEWPYKNVPPRIIAEKYMVDESGYELKDYKFFCFEGEVKFFKIDFDRAIEHRANYYNIDGNLLPFGETACPPKPERTLSMPLNQKKMILFAEQFSKGIPFLRVDFYEIEGELYFGELTFLPASGFGRLVPEEWDYKLGEWIKLPGDITEEKV